MILRVMDERSAKLRRTEGDVDRRIREVLESTQIGKLPGAGRPFADTSHTGDGWAAKHIVENANASSEWADLRKEIDARIDKLRTRVKAHRQWLHDRTLLLSEVAADRVVETAHATAARDLRVRGELEAQIGEVNALIRRYDLIVVPVMQLPLLTLERLGVA